MSVDNMRQSKLSLLGPPPMSNSVIHPQSSPSLLSKPVNTNPSNKSEWVSNSSSGQLQPSQPPSLLSQRIIPPASLVNNPSTHPPFMPLKKNQNWRTSKTRTEKQGFFYNSGSHW